MSLLRRIQIFLLKVFYLFANWRGFIRIGGMRYLGARTAGGSARTPAEITDRFQEIFYDGQNTADGWKHLRWLGVETWKCPTDLWVYQEMLSELKPDLVIETGTAHGGSALFMASIFDLLRNGEVVTIDINERPGRPTHPRITYLTGSSTSDGIVEQARLRAARASKVMVILDSDHRKAHVLDELRRYAPLVTPGQFLVVEDTNVNGHPVLPEFGPGPMEAVTEFLQTNPAFAADRTRERLMLTFNPGGYLRRR